MTYLLRLLLCIGVIELSTNQNVGSSNVESQIYKSIDFIRIKLNALETEVRNSIETMQGRLSSLIDSAYSEVDGALMAAQSELNLLGKECRSQALDKLGDVRDGFVMDLINCKRNQDMITDVEKIVYGGRDLMDGFVSSAESLIQGFEGCLTFNPFEMGYCFTKQTIHTGVLIATESALALEFTFDVAEDTEDLVATAIWCIRNANSTVHQTVHSIMGTAHTCHEK